jgi:membrane fusion protein (multidrug efflux system)
VPVTRLLRVTGSLTADEEAEVAAETAGRVIETPVERGSRVDEGSPLLRLVQTEAEAALREAEANVGQIEVRLGLGGDQPFDAERVPEVSNARAAKELAEAEFTRIRKLYDDHVVSGSEYDQRRTQVELTGRLYDTARNSARQLYRSLEASRARLTLAKKTFADTVVRSPFAGLVVERQVSIGDFVTRGTKVVTVVRINPLRLELTVPEQSLSIVRPGQSLEFQVDAYPGRTFKGQVRYVSPALRADQRALTVEAVVPNADGTLRPGLFATAAIQQSGTDRALCVPSSAVRNLAGSTRLYLIKGDRVEERIVTIGQVVGDSVEIANGVGEGDEVAQTNVTRLADGARVKVERTPGVGTVAGPGRTAR